MKLALVTIETRNRPLRVATAESFGERLLGLSRSGVLRYCDALRLPQCRAVHTLRMRIPIDVAFVSVEGRILRLQRGLAPWRVAVCWSAAETWEFAAGTLRQLGLTRGDPLRWPA